MNSTHGPGNVAEKEQSLAGVLVKMLQAPDHWDAFAVHYLEALDTVAEQRASTNRRFEWSADPDRKERARALAEWHELLMERLVGAETDALLDRLVAHPAMHGAEIAFVQARIAHVRGETDRARKLMHDCLTELPGHRGFLDFAERVGAPLPPRARGPTVIPRGKTEVPGTRSPATTPAPGKPTAALLGPP